MLMRTDPFRDLDRLAESVFGTTERPAVMPMDAYRLDDTFVIELELPGIDPESIDLTVERNVLTVHADRRRPEIDGAERIVGERAFGTFSRQMFLGDTLDVDALDAEYTDGVLAVRIPVAEQAKPRRIQIGRGSAPRQLDEKLSA